MELSKISFNTRYLTLMKDLTGISPSMIFNKTEESKAGDPPVSEKKITVIRTNKSKSIFFKVTAPEDYFLFEGEKIAFYNFMEFYSLMNVFELTGLYHMENSIIIESKVGKVNYVLADAESLIKSPSRINLSAPDLTFKLSSTDLKNMQEINKIVNARYANISFKEGKLGISLFNSSHQNSFDLFLDVVNPDIDSFDFPIYSEIFSRLPIDIKGEFFSEYVGSIYVNGFVSFAFNKENIDFLSGTGKVKQIGEENEDGGK